MNCEKNNNIGCTVENCKFHCKDENYCTKNCIEIGECCCNPETSESTCCNSFEPRVL